MKRLPLVISPILGLFWGLCASFSADAQSSPGLYNGQVPTAGQWNSYFAAKQDFNPGFFGAPYTWTAPQTWSAQATFGAHVAMIGSPPTPSSCGTSPTVAGSDGAGEITTGTGNPTSCVITFAVAYTTTPVCVVRDRTALSTLVSYVLSATAITMTTSAASSQKIDYICFGD